ncbi:MAG: hypothetical protein JNJ57_11610 [Saprospiraceae bacterium]|nr:hypothetical protein [Saprospiraceae bacterium]
MKYFILTTIIIACTLNSPSAQEVKECIIGLGYQALYEELKIIEKDTTKNLSASTFKILDSLVATELLISQNKNEIMYKNANKASTLRQPNKGIMPIGYSIETGCILLKCKELLTYNSGNPLWADEIVEYVIDAKTDFIIHDLGCWSEKTALFNAEKEKSEKVQTHDGIQNNAKSNFNNNNFKSYRTYYQGARGGCYYINSKGNKVYVDRSFCN